VQPTEPSIKGLPVRSEAQAIAISLVNGLRDDEVVFKLAALGKTLETLDERLECLSEVAGCSRC